MARQAAGPQIDWAVLTPIGPEWAAFGDYLLDCVPVAGSLVPARIGRIGTQQVVSALVQKGEANAATSLQFVLDRWKPRWVMLLGIAGGFSESGIALGDVVLGSFIYHLDFGKIVGGKFRRRPEYDFQPDRILLSHAEAFIATNPEWTRSIALSRPDRRSAQHSRVHVGYIASSDKVVDDAHSPIFQSLRSTVPEVHAVEMEASGVGAAVRLEQGRRLVGFMTIRGISDLCDGERANGSAQRAAWKRYASTAAATLASGFIRSFEGTRSAPRLLFDHKCKPCFGRGYYGSNPSETCRICAGKGHLFITGSRSSFQRCRPCGGCGHYGDNPRATCQVCGGFGIVSKPAITARPSEVRP